MTNLDSILKSRDITLPKKVRLVKAIGEGNGTPLQYSCLENPMARGAWQVQSTGSQESDTTEQLNHHQVCHSFSSKEQASFNFMAAVTICSDFGAPQK